MWRQQPNRANPKLFVVLWVELRSSLPLLNWGSNTTEYICNWICGEVLQKIRVNFLFQRGQNTMDKNFQEEFTQIIKFEPPLYKQRYQFVKDLVEKYKPKKVGMFCLFGLYIWK